MQDNNQDDTRNCELYGVFEGVARMELSTHLTKLRNDLDNRLESLLPPDTSSTRVHKAMRYAVLSGGKRIRPLITMLSAELIGVEPNYAIDVAAAMEMVHTSSLILDDLPSMDDSKLRRGVKTTHSVFGEDVAILASFALLARAFEAVSDFSKDNDLPGSTASEMTRVLARTVGSEGLIGGQLDDLYTKTNNLDLAKLKSIHLRKTGSLFSASATLGVLAAGGGEEELIWITKFVENIGLAFQIVDDVLDAEGEKNKLGKDTGKDRNRVSFCSIISVDEARRAAEEICDESVGYLERYGEKAEGMKSLANLILSRDT